MQTLNENNNSGDAGLPSAARTTASAPAHTASGAPAGISAWVQAARPVAHPMIFIPLLIGQLFALYVYETFDWAAFAGALLFGVLYQVYLLYTNDHADEAIDRTNEQHWLSGGSRVLPEGKLRSDQLLAGARIALASLAVLTLYLAVFSDRPCMPVALLLAVALCWGYNRRPLQLSYRGLGEILQGIGCGVLLPLIGYYLQQGTLVAFPWGALIPLYLVFHAGNIVTALPDYVSDKAGDKNTFPVRHGELAARGTASLLLGVAYLSLFFVSPQIALLHAGLITAPALLVLFGVVATGLLRRADVADFARCKAFVNWVSASQAWFLCAWAVALLLASTT